MLSDQEIDFSINDGDASFTLEGVTINKSRESMDIDLKATWTSTSSGGWWGSGSTSNTDFTLTADMITEITMDGESIIDFIKEENAGRLLITNEAATSTSSGSYYWSQTTVYTKNIKITLLDFVQDVRQTGKEYLEWSGNVGLTLTASDNTTITFDELTLATENAENVLFVDLINPEIEVLSSTINDENIDSVTIKVKATDKYFVPNSVFNTEKVKVTVDGVDYVPDTNNDVIKTIVVLFPHI